MLTRGRRTGIPTKGTDVHATTKAAIGLVSIVAAGSLVALGSAGGSVIADSGVLWKVHQWYVETSTGGGQMSDTAYRDTVSRYE